MVGNSGRHITGKKGVAYIIEADEYDFWGTDVKEQVGV